MTIIKYSLLMIVMLLATSATAAPSQAQLQQLATNYLHTHSADEHISAVAITIATVHDKNPLSVYAGTIALHQNDAINSQNLFQVGSIAKSFVAAILLKLESDPTKNFNINDPINQYFPEYKNWQDVTVKELLNMTSGIPDYLKDPRVLSDYAASPYQAYEPKEWVDRMYERKLLFKPGTEFNYSNTNYILLGLLIEKLTGHSLKEEIETQLIKPLALNHTFFVTHQPSAEINLQLVHGYQFERGLLNYVPLGTDVTDFSLSYMDAAGGLISNSQDIAKWTLALFTPDKVLTEDQLQKLTAVFSASGEPTKLTAEHPDGYGLGIGIYYSQKLKTTVYIYQGMTLGYRAIYVYIPTKKTVIAITVNSSFDGKENHLLQLINQVGALVIT